MIIHDSQFEIEYPTNEDGVNRLTIIDYDGNFCYIQKSEKGYIYTRTMINYRSTNYLRFMSSHLIHHIICTLNRI